MMGVGSLMSSSRGSGEGGSAIPSWILTGNGSVATLDVDFVGNRAWKNGELVSVASIATTSRNAPGTYINAAGVVSAVSATVLRNGDLGLLCEPDRTNVLLWSRDLTNAVWTKSNITAAKDQTGADGVANSASSLTATSANGTCLQAVTLGSSARFQTAYVKRLVGSGAVSMTMDNGATWTAVTVTAAWTRVSIPTQTLANPTVGFRIATSGDAIAVDYVQNENGTYATSPLASTTTTANRGVDYVTMATAGWFNSSAGAIILEINLNAHDATLNGLLQIDDGAGNDRIQFYVTASAYRFQMVVSNVTQSGIQGGTSVVGSTKKMGVGYASNDAILCANNAVIGTDATVAVPLAGITTMTLGDVVGFASRGYIRRLTYWNTRLSNAVVQALTA